GADAELGDALHPVTDHRAGVGVDRALHGSLVVVDEQARGHEVFMALLDLSELEGCPDRVGRTAPELALVVDLRHLRPEVGLGRKRGQDRLRRRVHEVAGVGDVRRPPEPLDLPGPKTSVDTVVWHYIPP